MGDFYVGYCGEKLLGWSNQGGEVREPCLRMWGRGDGSIYRVLVEHTRKTGDLEDIGIDERK